MPTNLPHPLRPADVRLLTEIGFVAAAAGMQQQALRVFNGLSVLRPHRAFPYIGQATTHLNAGEHEQAEQALRRGRLQLDEEARVEPGTELLIEDRALLAAFHGLALQLGQRNTEAARALSDALSLQADGPAARMACAMLGLPMPAPKQKAMPEAPPATLIPAGSPS